MISSSQIKAARSLLGWSAKDLALQSGVGVATIRRYEMEAGVPSANLQTISVLIRCFNKVGIEFLGDPELNPGVMLHIRQQD